QIVGDGGVDFPPPLLKSLTPVFDRTGIVDSREIAVEYLDDWFRFRLNLSGMDSNPNPRSLELLWSLVDGDSKRLAATGGEMVLDPRFAMAHTDPQFQKVPQRKTKVAIDSIFKRMFTNKNLGGSSTNLDKRGRQIVGDGGVDFPPPLPKSLTPVFDRTGIVDSREIAVEYLDDWFRFRLNLSGMDSNPNPRSLELLWSLVDGDSKRLAATGGEMVLDPRFAMAHTDPQFQKVPQRKTKVAIDSIFKRMFTNKNFGGSSTNLDKRGR
ncbi:unnamed protein product, partial [Linum tenue]